MTSNSVSLFISSSHMCRISNIVFVAFVLLSFSRSHGRICVQDQSIHINAELLNVCAEYMINDRSILVWFNLNPILNATFDQFRFVLRSRDRAISHGEYVQNITDFDRFDLENHVRVKNLDSGIYEICVEFRQNQSTFIYEPRDGCVTIQIGEVSYRTFDESSVPILIILAVSILVFFLLGLIVPPLKKKRDQARAASGASHRTRDTVHAWFQRHIVDQGRPTSLRQWARIRVQRHMHSLVHDRKDRILFPEILQRYTPETDRVFTIDIEKPKGKFKSNYEEYQMKEIR